jgi:hypothetical protein
MPQTRGVCALVIVMRRDKGSPHQLRRLARFAAALAAGAGVKAGLAGRTLSQRSRESWRGADR